MGCDSGSWYFAYREVEKKNTRHVHGKGEIYDTFPATDILHLLIALFPGFDPSNWFLEETTT